MGAEAHTELSLERCTQLGTIEDYDVVEEMAREAFHLAEWEAVAPEDLLHAWYLLHPYGP
jgi:hypothetical protein